MLPTHDLFDETPSRLSLWMDSITLPICINQWIQRHKSISAIATRGKSSMRWFFGRKLHALMNQSGGFVNTALSNGYTADIQMVEQLVKGLQKLYADRGYISQELKTKLK